MGILAAKRDKVKAAHKALVESKHSPWHPEAREHPDTDRKEPGYLALDQRPVALFDDKVTYFVGGCASQVLSALKAYAKKYEAAQAASTDPSDVPSWQARAAYAVASKASTTTKDGDVVLCFDRQDYNNALYALEKQGIKVASDQVKEPSPFAAL